MAGRPKGRKNKPGERLAAVIERHGYQAPSAFLLNVLTDEEQPIPARMDAAKALLPYELKKQPTAIDATHHAGDGVAELIDAIATIQNGRKPRVD